MKRILLTAFALALCAAIAAPAGATPQTLLASDTAIHWAGWGNGTSDDTNDVIGTPSIDNTVFHLTDAIKATLEVHRGVDNIPTVAYLKQVEFNYDLTGSFNVLQLGDLFIDDRQNDSWDWVIRASDIGRGTATAVGGTAVNVYDFRAAPIALGSRAGIGGSVNYNANHDPTNKYDYVFSGEAGINHDSNGSVNDNSVNGSGFNNVGVNWSMFGTGPNIIREDHPWAVSASRLLTGVDTDGAGAGDATVSGWEGTGSNQKLTFDIATLAGNPLPGVELALTKLGGIYTTAFRLGFTFNCGNDVIFENFTYSEFNGHEIPEPSTLLLLATGLVGLVAYRRKRA